MNPLEAAEAIDSYRRAISKSEPNRTARIGQFYELDAIPATTGNFLQGFAGKFPLLAPAEIAILNSSADGGLPHTRPPNLICLPASGIPNSPTAEFKETLLHEGIHIHQRLHPNLWITACERAGWRRVDAQRIPPEFADRVRINPDTMAAPFWAYNDHHVPLPLFPKGVSLPSLGAAEIQWLDLRTATLYHEPPTSFRTRAKETGAATEHPFELYAYRFSRQGLQSAEQIEKALTTI